MCRLAGLLGDNAQGAPFHHWPWNLAACHSCFFAHVKYHRWCIISNQRVACSSVWWKMRTGQMGSPVALPQSNAMGKELMCPLRVASKLSGEISITVLHTNYLSLFILPFLTWSLAFALILCCPEGSLGHPMGSKVKLQHVACAQSHHSKPIFSCVFTSKTFLL